MKVDFYLIVNERGSVRLTKTKGSMKFDEIAVGIRLELPDALFYKPHLSAGIKIPDDAATPQEITAEVIENCKEAIEQATNLKVSLRLVDERVCLTCQKGFAKDCPGQEICRDCAAKGSSTTTSG